MIKARVVLAYENMEEKTFDFSHLKTFCNLFEMDLRQPEPLCVEKKRNCTLDEYGLNNWDTYLYNHHVHVHLTYSDSNLLCLAIDILRKYAVLKGMVFGVLEIEGGDE